MNNKQTEIKFLSPHNLYQQIEKFTNGMAVTKGQFEYVAQNCTLQDMEWNHMDQLHRLAIHNTYEKNVRIALGNHFALSLTQWKKWPLLITVTDVYVAEGLFYQSLTIAGVIFLHSIISMEVIGDSVKLKDEWFIASHKFFRFTHKFLDKKLYQLNARLQQEDEQLRQGRFNLRKQGYRFQTDQPNYYNSNIMSANTLYPTIEEDACFSLDDVGHESCIKKIGPVEFIVKKDLTKNTYLIWPAICPHEGGSLIEGKMCDSKILCPWHHLTFSAVQLSEKNPFAAKYKFEYMLKDNKIYVKQLVSNSVENISLSEVDSE